MSAGSFYKPSYRHGLPFSPFLILQALKIKPFYPGYSLYFSQAYIIMQEVLMRTAIQLNKQLKADYVRFMSGMFEYMNFPDYMNVITEALSNPEHVKVVINRRGIWQAQFVDVKLLGGIEDLRAAQQHAWPERGTLKDWTGLYKGFLARDQTSVAKYTNTIRERLSYMRARKIAPFWGIIEDGNEKTGFPENPPIQIIQTMMRLNYKAAMRRAFLECFGLISKLLSISIAFLARITVGDVYFRGQTYPGYYWTSNAGNLMFVRAGTEKIIGKNLFATGFRLDATGKVISRWSGWIPTLVMKRFGIKGR